LFGMQWLADEESFVSRGTIRIFCHSGSKLIFSVN
jgi:hypothetical protein